VDLALAGEGARSAPGPLRSAPRAVTTGGKSDQAAIVDWLNVSFIHERDPYELCGDLSELMEGRHVAWSPCSGGKHGFEHGVRLLAYAAGQLVPFAMYSWGGESQRGRALLSIEGGGCRLISDWDAMAHYVSELPGFRITRVDLAVDVHDGSFSVDDCASWAMEGRLNSGGRNPALDTQGDWLTRQHGRTLYVGKAQNGKMMRCYEKGKQLGDLESPWVRWEVQFGNRDREVPLAILTERDKFFAGAYPALEELVQVVGEAIRTVQETTRCTIENAVKHLRRSYGKWVHFITSHGVEIADLVEAVRVRAVPSRLSLASVADAGLAATVHAAVHRRSFA
jgi:phage replication initiation protein